MRRSAMNLNELQDSLGDYAKDIKLNLSNVLMVDPSNGLSETQIYGVAIASVYSTKNQELVKALLADNKLEEAYVIAAKAAATLMAMNNVYYRSLHMVENKE